MRKSSRLLINQLFKPLEESSSKHLVQFSTSTNELNLKALAASSGCPFHHERNQESSSFDLSATSPSSSGHSSSFSSTSFNSTLSSIESNRSTDSVHFVDKIKALFQSKPRTGFVSQQLSNFLRIPKTATVFPTLTSILRLSLNGGVSYLHKHCDKLHEQHGPIYREKLGPVEGVFIADDELIKEVFSQEDTSPTHLIPEPWIIYNEINNVKRGLFFL